MDAFATLALYKTFMKYKKTGTLGGRGDCPERVIEKNGGTYNWKGEDFDKYVLTREQADNEAFYNEYFYYNIDFAIDFDQFPITKLNFHENKRVREVGDFEVHQVPEDGLCLLYSIILISHVDQHNYEIAKKFVDYYKLYFPKGMT